MADDKLKNEMLTDEIILPVLSESQEEEKIQ